MCVMPTKRVCSPWDCQSMCAEHAGCHVAGSAVPILVSHPLATGGTQEMVVSAWWLFFFVLLLFFFFNSTPPQATVPSVLYLLPCLLSAPAWAALRSSPCVPGFFPAPILLCSCVCTEQSLTSSHTVSAASPLPKPCQFIPIRVCLGVYFIYFFSIINTPKGEASRTSTNVVEVHTFFSVAFLLLQCPGFS